eukprot:1799972-Prymnesium_polylepis.2
MIGPGGQREIGFRARRVSLAISCWAGRPLTGVRDPPWRVADYGGRCALSCDGAQSSRDRESIQKLGRWDGVYVRQLLHDVPPFRFCFSLDDTTTCGEGWPARSTLALNRVVAIFK